MGLAEWVDYKNKEKEKSVNDCIRRFLFFSAKLFFPCYDANSRNRTTGVLEGTFSVERTVRTSRGTAVGVVAELVDVHSSLGVGVVAGNVVGDGGGRGLGVLLKAHDARDFGVSAKDGD